MRALVISALLLMAGCASQVQQLENDRCHGHWQVVTTEVNGKTVYKAECAKP